jgi:hypothetical protein
LYPTQPYDRAKFGQAMDNLPKKATEPTMLTKGLKKLDPLLAAYLNENKNAYVSLLHPHWEPFQNGLTGQTFFHRHIHKLVVCENNVRQNFRGSGKCQKIHQYKRNEMIKHLWLC